MSNDGFKSELPAAGGSPFRTKNFNKFFFGIIIAALILVAIFFAFFYHAAAKNRPLSPGTSSAKPGFGVSPAGYVSRADSGIA